MCQQSVLRQESNLRLYDAEQYSCHSPKVINDLFTQYYQQKMRPIQHIIYADYLL